MQPLDDPLSYEHAVHRFSGLPIFIDISTLGTPEGSFDPGDNGNLTPVFESLALFPRQANVYSNPCNDIAVIGSLIGGRDPWVTQFLSAYHRPNAVQCISCCENAGFLLQLHSADCNRDRPCAELGLAEPLPSLQAAHYRRLRNRLQWGWLRPTASPQQ